MIAGTIYVVFFTDNFIGPFQGFLITLGVPVAAWGGVMMADIALRRKDYADAELYDPARAYGDVRWLPSRWWLSAPRSAGAWSPTPPPAG